MNKKILQYILGFLGVIFIVRFFLPGILMGGDYVLETDLVTAHLDSEIRFLSTLAGGYAVLFFYLIKEVEKKLGIILIIALSALFGGMMRVISLVQYGLPPLEAQIAIGLEFVMPLVVLTLRHRIAKEYV